MTKRKDMSEEEKLANIEKSRDNWRKNNPDLDKKSKIKWRKEQINSLGLEVVREIGRLKYHEKKNNTSPEQIEHRKEYMKWYCKLYRNIPINRLYKYVRDLQEREWNKMLLIRVLTKNKFMCMCPGCKFPINQSGSLREHIKNLQLDHTKGRHHKDYYKYFENYKPTSYISSQMIKQLVDLCADGKRKFIVKYFRITCNYCNDILTLKGVCPHRNGISVPGYNKRIRKGVRNKTIIFNGYPPNPNSKVLTYKQWLKNGYKNNPYWKSVTKSRG